MKTIKLTPKTIDFIKKDIAEQLNNVKLQDSKLSFTYDLTKLAPTDLSNLKRPVIYMSGTTYLKMLEYVLECDTELAWHGTVVRGTGNKSHIFHIKDVYLYPQIVTGATVTTDDDKYTQWSDAQSDEDFNNRRFQGHSHVNMATAYSGTDLSNQNKFLQDLAEDDYYIFLVTNKKQEHNFKIYDLAQNIIFDNCDIDFRVYLTPEKTLKNIKTEITENCVKKVPSYVGSYNTYKYLDTIEETDDPTAVKRNVIILNRFGRDFEKEHKTIPGDPFTLKKRDKYGLPIKVFVPYEPLDAITITELRKEGWHVSQEYVPAFYDKILE